MEKKRKRIRIKKPQDFYSIEQPDGRFWVNEDGDPLVTKMEPILPEGTPDKVCVVRLEKTQQNRA